MNTPRLQLTVTLTTDGAFAISTDYSPDLTVENAQILKAIFEEHAVRRVVLELETQFKQ